ncbi:ABC transporter permease subunit [Leifsonia sp. NPDC102414]|uniref:ABC transporter permease subunit n=1 Tax=Leifsonia sp. NPDC102414 TaxID=3364124 RepID=UPI00382ECF66
MIWLVWRQHRAAYWTLLAATALSVAWIILKRADLADYLAAHGWPSATGKWVDGLGPYQFELQKVGLGLGFAPILLGVFLAAPLLAGDLESGTAKLIASQSASRIRWLCTKLGLSMLVVVLCTTALSIAFGWWFEPIKSSDSGTSWSDGFIFDNTGPVPVALALFTVAAGMAIGMILRRTLLSMVVTFVAAVIVQLLWGRARLHLGDVITLTTTGKDHPMVFPEIPHGAIEIDRWYATGSGGTRGLGTCINGAESIRAACRQKADISGWSIDYLPISQLHSMQWFGASILFVLTALITVFILLRGHKRVV